MDIALLIIRLMLTAVFLVAGFAKLADLAGSRAALRDFGVPGTLASPFGVLLPLTELAVAVALLPSVSAWWGAMGALVLLLLFVAGISYNLARGRTPDCHCFGQLHSTPVGPSTLIRNLVLAATALVIIWFGHVDAGLDVWSWFGALSVAQRIEVVGGLLVVVVLVGHSWLLWQIMSQQGRWLLRVEDVESQQGRWLLRVEDVEAHLFHGKRGPLSPPGAAGLGVGEPAPDFKLPDLDGNPVTLDSLLSQGKEVILFFSFPDCIACAALWPEIGPWQSDYARRLQLVVVSRGEVQALQSIARTHGIRSILLQQGQEVQALYRVAGRPSAVLIHPDGSIGSELAQGIDAIRGLMAYAIGLSGRRPVPMDAASPQKNGIGEQAQAFSLPDLAGWLLHLSDFRGKPTLLLFWRPSCSFCQRMLPALHAWEAQPPAQAPSLLVISSESVQDNQAMGLRSPVVLDPDGMSIASQFGATGTPMAVLLDAEGRIASDLATGEQAIFALAGLELKKTIPT